MSDISVAPAYWTLLEALKQTALPIDLKQLRSQQGLRWLGLGPTPESDLLLPIEKWPQHHRPSLLPGRVIIRNYDRIDPRGFRQDLEGLRRAASPLRRALIAEVMQATGIPFGKNERVSILSDLWRGFILNFETSSVEDTGGRRFDGVRITHAAVATTEAPSEVQFEDLPTASGAYSQNASSLPGKTLEEETRLKLKAIVAFYKKGGRSKGSYRNIPRPTGGVSAETEFAYRIMLEVRPDLKRQHNIGVEKRRTEKANLESAYVISRAPRDTLPKLKSQPRVLKDGFAGPTIKKLVLDLESNKHSWLIEGVAFKRLLNSPGTIPPDIDNQPCE